MSIRQWLFENQDIDYKAFQSKLIPDIDDELIIGVRIPVLRKKAKEIAKTPEEIGDCYYEERMLRGFIIGYSNASCDEKLAELRDYIPLIDNWAVCDCVCATLKFAEKNKNKVWSFISEYLKSDREYEVRFAVVMMLDYFISDDYIERVLGSLVRIRSEYYYVNMAVAWAMSVAYVSYSERVEGILREGILSQWVHNKTIQKICESYRVSKEDKINLRKLKK